ncbi:arginine--tRNA ligase [bacterium]|nr:arginine--tRNA ligase [bacterium]
MLDLAQQIQQLLVPRFQEQDLDPTLAEVRRCDRPDLGDFQCNGAMAGAKQRKENPRALAEKLMPASELFASTSIAGPGFLNFVLSNEALSRRAQAIAGDPRSGVAVSAERKKILIDFSGPNVAKPMHVGHLRATIIGDSLQRIARFLGHQVTSDAHFGDWGLQIGLLITAVQDEQPDLPYFRPDYAPENNLPESPVTMEDLDRMYPAASARMKEDEAYRDRARKATAELQKGRPGYLALHRHFWTVSQVALNREFEALDIHFDLWKGESDVNYLIEGVVEECRRKGVSVPSQGAEVIEVARESDAKSVPPLILVSSEGSAMYGTTDLATIVERCKEVDPDLLWYVVDQRQALHFVQVFRAADRAGYCPENRLEHLGFGTMNGPDKKPFKTRAGDVIKLHDLIQTCRGKALQKMDEAGLAGDLSPAEKERTALAIGVAALKFADLCNYRMTDYVFDFDRFTSFEGKTGAYLQFQAVRVKSLMRNATPQDLEGQIVVEHGAERQVVLALDAFSGALRLAFERRAPHFVAEHVYTLAQAFSSLWTTLPLLKEADPAKRASRLQLSRAVLAQLEIGLRLLGISVPERM